MVGCCAPNCSSNTRKGDRFFRFPLDNQRCLRWLVNCRRDKWTPKTSSRLCERHFEPNQFERNVYKKLKPFAIPTLFNVPNPPKKISGTRRVLKRHFTTDGNSSNTTQHRDHTYAKHCKNENEPSKKFVKDVGNNSLINSKQNSGNAQSLMQNGPKSNEASWRTELRTEFSKPYYIKLQKFVAQERSKRTVYPDGNLVFSWMNHCNIRDVKVVILGQDPYHGPNQAHGLCFSVQKGVRFPPSLENIFKELGNDIEGFVQPSHGDLTSWAKQGVLLLNAVLTVRASQANSHKDQGWETFTDAVISWINKNLNGVVFLLWGSYAQKKGSRINLKKHHVLKSVHPSPLSAYRGFFGSKHFSRTNELLKKKGKKLIRWSDL